MATLVYEKFKLYLNEKCIQKVFRAIQYWFHENLDAILLIKKLVWKNCWSVASLLNEYLDVLLKIKELLKKSSDRDNTDIWKIQG